jgi:hypothetical protein
MCSKEAILASIRKRQNRWEVRVRRANYPTKCKTFSKLADAKIWAHQTELNWERLANNLSPALIQITLDQAEDRYLSSTIALHRGKDSERYRLASVINRLGRNKNLSEIKPSDIAHYRDTRLGEVASGTVRRELVVISGLFNTARNEWDMGQIANPVRGVKMPPDSPNRTRRLNEHENQHNFSDRISAGQRFETQLAQPRHLSYV